MDKNNYCIIQTSEHNDTFLSVLPSLWVIENGWEHNETEDTGNCIAGDDLCYWPKGVFGYRLLEKSKKDPYIQPDIKVLRAFRCKIKRNKFATYSEAFCELKKMEMYSDTEEGENETKKVSKTSTAADMFKRIQQSNLFEYTTQTQNVEMPKTSNYFLPQIKTQIDVACSSTQLESPRTSVSQLSGLEAAPSVIQSSSDTLTKSRDLLKLLQSLHDKVDENTQSVGEYKLIVNRSVVLLSQINAKLDLLANQINMTLDVVVSQKAQQSETMSIETTGAPLSPIKTIQDLESLEKKSNDKQFAGVVVQYFGSMHGKDRYVGKGGTVCLQIVDYFLT
ncbi:uncharacterized protein LOC128735974 [Sabethes cyaneus]|uniref:uncharacterized protein LOC128735974 n=1 Tax=Sabethes cyaneus TaxID=53552 RepID=UPI00237DCDD0|nr:uncharacterized protein LOC128735974 [Sabethes cyaneus]